MLKVSTRSTYAIRALLDLVQNSQDRPERLPHIAERQNIPLPYLEQIFSKLKKAGLIKAVRGPLGGYQLSKPPEDISLADIVITLEGPMEPVLCSQPEIKSEECHVVEGCLSRFICHELDGEVLRILKKNTLGAMVGEANRLREHRINFNYGGTISRA